MKKRFVSSIISALVVAALTFSIAFAKSKSYYGLTTVYFNNGIVNQTSTSWNANYSDYTSPSRSMDIFGVNVWTAYVSCGSTIQFSTYVQYQVQNQPWLYHYNVTTSGDGMAMAKVSCPSGTRYLNNRIQHYWQDSGKPGDGGTINQAKAG